MSDVHETCCDVCGLGHEDPPMLLCDACDSGFHVLCLSPPLERIPDGSWFCPRCVDGSSGERHAPTVVVNRSPTRAAGSTRQSPFDFPSALDVPIDDVFQLRDVVVPLPTPIPKADGGSLSTLFKTIFEGVLTQIESYDAVNKRSLFDEISQLEARVTASVRDEFSHFKRRFLDGRDVESRPTSALNSSSPHSSPSRN